MRPDLHQLANLRDLGGWITEDGLRVRSGKIYRSAILDAEDPRLLEGLRALRLATIVDLRSDEERTQLPTPWETIGCEDYWCREHGSTSGDLRLLLARGDADPAQIREAMFAIYRTTPANHAESFRGLFGKLLAGRTPLLFHCSAGKDRTGAAAALILAALGVPRESILEDYLRTNSFDYHNAPWRRRPPPPDAPPPPPEAVLRPVLAAEPGYLEALFEALETGFGSVEAYLDREVGVGDRQIAQLRDQLLEPVQAAASA